LDNEEDLRDLEERLDRFDNEVDQYEEYEEVQDDDGQHPTIVGSYARYDKVN